MKSKPPKDIFGGFVVRKKLRVLCIMLKTILIS